VCAGKSRVARPIAGAEDDSVAEDDVETEDVEAVFDPGGGSRGTSDMKGGA
jgi:hypothetical protein